MVGVEDGIHFIRRIDLVLLSRHFGGFVVDGVVDFAQERGGGCCKPASAAKLEGPQVAAPVGGA